MTISRSQLQQLRDMARADAKGHEGDVDRHLNKIATELDAVDAVFARHGIDSLWSDGGRSPEKPKDPA